jgi:hypothetical protein
MEAGNAHLQFGAVDESAFTFIDLEEDLFWGSMAQGIAFGDLSNDYRVADSDENPDGKVYTIFNSASATIDLPKHMFDDYLTYLFYAAGLRDGNYDKSSAGGITAQCASYPKLHFMFQGNWLSVEPEDYVVDISDSQDGSRCQVLIGESDLPFISMGLPMFKGYNMVFNDKDAKIGFAPTANSKK